MKKIKHMSFVMNNIAITKGIKHLLAPFASIATMTMGVKFLTDRIVPHEESYWFYEDKYRVRKRMLGLGIKSLIKGLSYAAITAGLQKNGHTYMALFTGAFGIADTLSSLPTGFLSPQVSFLLKRFGEKMNQKQRAKELTKKNDLYANLHARTTFTINKKFIDVCVLPKGLDLFNPVSEIAKENEKDEDHYKQMYFENYANSCGLFNLKNIVKQHTMLNERLEKFYKKDCYGKKGRYYHRFGEPLKLKNSYEIVRDLGIRDIVHSYFLQSDETAKTWNLLPWELVEYIFSFFSCRDDVCTLLNYTNELIQWKHNKRKNRIPQCPIIALDALSWARFLKGASVTLYKGSEYARVKVRHMDIQVPASIIQQLLNIMNDRNCQKCLKNVNYEITHRDNTQESIERLQCRVNKVHDIFVYEGAWKSPDSYKEVEVLYAREEANTLETSNKLIIIRFSTTSNPESEKVKLEKSLYETLYWLAGPNGIVELAYTFNKLEERHYQMGINSGNSMMLQLQRVRI